MWESEFPEVSLIKVDMAVIKLRWTLNYVIRLSIILLVDLMHFLFFTCNYMKVRDSEKSSDKQED